jgi:hypothetical protein
MKKKKKKGVEKTLINGMTPVAAILSCHAKQRSPQQQRVNTREVLIIVPIGSLFA